jgi:tight adherence protein C
MALLDTAILVCFGGSIALVLWTLYAIGRRVGERMPAERTAREMRERWLQLLLFLAEPLADMLESYLRRSPHLLLTRILHHYDRQIRTAGLSGMLRPSEVLAMIPIAGTFGFFLGVVSYVMLPYPAVAAAFVLLGMALPGVWLADQARKRQEEIRRSLPFAIDLLTLMTEAGLDFTIALERISQKLASTALGQEFTITQKEIRMGKNRSEAVRNLAQRVNLLDVSTLCSAIVQADELGTGFGTTLRVQAEQIRVAHAQQIERKALEAPVKILFPTTFVVIFGPVFLSYLR